MKHPTAARSFSLLCFGLLAALFLFSGLSFRHSRAASHAARPREPVSSLPSPASAPGALSSSGAVSSSAKETAAASTADDAFTETKKIALTFDDGPHIHYTAQLLDGLKERGVKATFFITGENAAAYPELVRRLDEEGHLIGNHTYHHIQLTAANEAQFREEILTTNEEIKKITGEDTCYIRPPYGSWNKSYESELNMFPVLWTIDPLDWCSKNVASIVSRVVSNAGENDIILMHDQYPSSVTSALQIVDILQEEGYEFVTVEEILFD